jgi:dTMP kinase
MKKRGTFLVLEGTDGSGKTVQFELLKKYFSSKKVPYEVLDFPQYGFPSAYFVEKYLNGEYGQNIPPKIASLFYALDRYEVSFKLRKWLREGKTVLANRFVASNMGHQGAKIRDRKARAEFIQWVYNIEYTVLGIPKPNVNIMLRVPPRLAYDFIAQKAERSYLKGKKRDIHEQSLQHLVHAFEAYAQTISMFPKEFIPIECAPRNRMLSIEEIHACVVEKIKK